MGALIALTLDEGDVNPPAEHGMQLYRNFQRVDQSLGRLADGSLPGDVERLGIVVQAFQHLEQVDTYSMYGGRYATQVYVRAFVPNGELLPGSVRLYGVGGRVGGGFDLIDIKLSTNAPSTKNQEVHYPALEQYGGLVTRRRGGIIGLPKGTVLGAMPLCGRRQL